MLESEIKTRCKKQLKEWGWIVLHLIQTNENGTPDTLCLRNNQAVFIEFKQSGKEPRDLQEYRIKKLRAQGFEVLAPVSSLRQIQHLK